MFSLEKIRAGDVIYIDGGRACGKTTLIGKILDHLHPRKAYTNSMFPNCTTITDVEKELEGQTDCTIVLENTSQIPTMMTHSQAYKHTWIINSAHLPSIPMQKRNRFDYVFVSWHPDKSYRRKLYKSFFTIFDSFEGFDSVLSDMTKQYTFLVIDRRLCDARIPQECVFLYKATIPPQFALGELKLGCIIFIDGKRGSGRNKVAHAIIKQFDIPAVALDNCLEACPSIDMLQNVKNIYDRTVVITPSVATPKWENDFEMMIHGRYFRQNWIVLSQQLLLEIPPRLRPNCDYLFVQWYEGRETRKRLYDQYFKPCFDTLETFESMFAQATIEKQTFLVLDRHAAKALLFVV